jgi:hypothetical protein
MDRAITTGALAEVANVRLAYTALDTELQNIGGMRTPNFAYTPASQGAAAEMLEYLNAITNCGNGPVAGTNGIYNKFGKNINHLTNCGSCTQTDVWVYDAADCPLGAVAWTG